MGEAGEQGAAGIGFGDMLEHLHAGDGVEAGRSEREAGDVALEEVQAPVVGLGGGLVAQELQAAVGEVEGPDLGAALEQMGTEAADATAGVEDALAGAGAEAGQDRLHLDAALITVARSAGEGQFAVAELAFETLQVKGGCHAAVGMPARCIALPRAAGALHSAAARCWRATMNTA